MYYKLMVELGYIHLHPSLFILVIGIVYKLILILLELKVCIRDLSMLVLIL